MTDAYVVDSGIFVRWYVDQNGFEHAREVQQRFLDGDVRLETTDFTRVEVANILRKKGFLGKLLDRDMFLAAVRDIDDLGVLVHTTNCDRLERAAALAIDHSLRIYDAVLVQIALEQGLPLLTTDAKLCKAVDGLISTELLRGVL